WDAMFAMMGVGMFRSHDRILQYYSGVDFGHGGTRKESRFSKQAENRRRWGTIGAVQQRLDGFFSMDAEYAGGTLTTVPIVFSGHQLEINVNTSSAGSAQVELQRADGTVIDGYALEDCDPVMSNDAHCRVTWHGNSDVSALSDRPIRVRFQM